MAHEFFGNILNDKRILITGANRGLGLLMAKRFLECGARVIICSAPNENVNEAVEQLKRIDTTYDCMGCKPNLTDEEEIEKLLNIVKSGWGGIDVLVNNAGIYPFHRFEDYPQELFHKIFELNVTGAFTMSKKIAELMKENENGGVILNTNSLAGVYGAMANVGYTASKFALQGLTIAMARELGKYKIRVNGIAPAGILKTDIYGNLINEPSNILDEEYKNIENVLEVTKAFAPLGDYRCHPDEVINAFIFLASDAASFISGQTLAIDGACIWPAANPMSCLS